MTHAPLLSARAAADRLDEPGTAFVDCRFALADPARGRVAYREGHIPGAVYAQLDDDLSAPVVPGRTGRHPLPTPAVFAARLGAWGIAEGVHVVAYDDAGGVFAARLWWMLRWLGHDASSVLDGGLPAWLRAGLPTRAGVETRTPRPFAAHPRPEMVIEAGALAGDAAPACLLDARAPARFRGDEEPLDPVAGHIPGAGNLHFATLLGDDGTFREADALRAHLEAIVGDAGPEGPAVYCGSGVTAAHLALAFAHAGLEMPRLYPGSWSEWITDPARPVAVGG